MVIEARQVTPVSVEAVAEWCAGIVPERAPSGRWWCSPGLIAIQTLEGTMWANLNDWVIRGVRGEFYPCKPDIFAETYEEVADDD